MGLCHAFVEGDRPDTAPALELCTAVLGILKHLEPGYWGFVSLSRSAEWTQVRTLARELLATARPMVTPPRAPFKIENLIHVDHYLHAAEARAQLDPAKNVKASVRDRFKT